MDLNGLKRVATGRTHADRVILRLEAAHKLTTETLNNMRAKRAA